MPDPIRIAAAAAVAFVVAAVGAWLAQGRLDPRWRYSALALVLAGGFYAGCRVAGLWPHWPPREDQDRLLIVVVPLVALVECLAATERFPAIAEMLLRFAAALAIAPILLAGTGYVTNAAGPDSRIWSVGEMLAKFAGLGLALSALWWGVVRLGRRAPGLSVPLSLAGVLGGAGMAIMLSGYLSAGQLAFPMSAALLGIAAIDWGTARRSNLDAPLALASCTLFSLLLSGHFFGELPMRYALLLGLAPLAGWLAEFRALDRFSSMQRGWLRVTLIAAMVGCVTLLAARQFAASSSNMGGSAAGADDYLNYGS